jgi:hypothetical protein
MGQTVKLKVRRKSMEYGSRAIDALVHFDGLAKATFATPACASLLVPTKSAWLRP